MGRADGSYGRGAGVGLLIAFCALITLAGAVPGGGVGTDPTGLIAGAAELLAVGAGDGPSDAALLSLTVAMAGTAVA